MKKIILVGTLILYGIQAHAMERPPRVIADTDFFTAIENGDLKAVQDMLLEGANKNAINLYTESALQVAVKKGYRGIVAALLAAGANPNYIDSGYHEETILTVAAAIPFDDPTIVGLLLDKGANRNIKNSRGMIPYEVACANRNMKIARRLLPGSDAAAVEKAHSRIRKEQEREWWA